MRVFFCVLMALAACSKARTTESPPAETEVPPVEPTPSVIAVDAAMPVAPVDTIADAVATDESASNNAQLHTEPGLVPAGSNDIGAALAKDIGGSNAPAGSGRSLIVIKNKKALEPSTHRPGEVALEFVRKGQASVRACFDAARAKQPTTEGVLTLRFAVDTNGALVDVSVDAWNPDVATCVREALPAWKFTPHEKKARFELVLELVIG